MTCNFRLSSIICISIIFYSLMPFINSHAQELSIIPKPVFVEQNVGSFNVNQQTKIIINDNSALPVAQYFEHFINPATGLSLPISHSKNNGNIKNVISIMIDESIKTLEGYQLTVTPERIIIKAASANGLFYAIQTLRQLLPPAIEKRYPINNVAWNIPAVTIKDQPRFEYRGMHLDVGRHFYPVSFIKKYIDLIALNKLNRFHWHLTEDQGWRIEIKKYPKLTSIGGYREGTVYGHPYDDGVRDDRVTYGGFYSQTEIKDIVAYAKERFVTIIPEIDLPGHSVAALTAYPELACTEGTFKVRTKWGVSKDVYCPSEQTFDFLENILNEVMDLFPSEYIHIGGDEAPKDRWKASELAQQVIKKNNLKNEHELQSYFIKRIEKMLNKRNRKLIGWDEILEGGLSKSATVMFWRSFGQHKDNIKQVLENGNPVIMTPVSHLYFDYYQSESMDEPKLWGSYLPLKKLYSYDPVFDGVTDKQAEQIKGAQGNVWTEYMPTDRIVEYQSQPRMAAVGELTWSAKKDKNWFSFVTRLTQYFDRLKVMDVNAATSVYNVHGELSENRKVLTLETDGANHQIRFTTNGTLPNGQSPLYQHPIVLYKTTYVRAIAEDKNTRQYYGDYKLSFIKHLALNKTVTFTGDTPKKHHKTGQSILTDGHISHDRHHMRLKNRWFGVKNTNVIATIDLEKSMTVSKVSFGFQPEIGIRLLSPETTTIELSVDGINWQQVAKEKTKFASRSGQTAITLSFGSQSARYVRLTAINAHRFDEIIVE
jgi:hexosaminidase